MSSDLRQLQELAGLLPTAPFTKPVNESLQGHNYVFLIVDPQTGECDEYGRGSPIQIMQQIANDPENSMLADVLKQRSFGEMDSTNGVLSFKYDDQIYTFVPL